MNPYLPWIVGTVALIGIVAACRGTSQEETTNKVASGPDPIPLAAQELVKGNLSSVRAQEVAIARSADEWLVLWRRHGGLQLPGPDLPEVDFDKNMVVATFLGERPTGGFSVEVRAVDHVPATGDEGERVKVTAVERQPEESSIQPQMIVSPFHMVVVPKCTGTAHLWME